MSSEWPFITFSEAPFLIIDGDRGTNYPKQHEFTSSGHCLFLNAGNVTKEGFAFSECAFISEEKDLLLRKGKLQRHDIVLTTRGTVGNVAYYSDNVEFDHIRINSGMVIFRPDPTQILPYYLYLFLRSNNFDEQVKSLTSGSAQPQLPIRDMNRIVIPLPPIEVQSEICITLGGFDDRIALLRETNATLEAIAQALFKSWFVDFDPVHANAGAQAPSLPAEIQALFPSRLVESSQGLIPEGWEVKPFGELLTHTIGGDWGDELPTDKNNVRVAIIRGTDLPDLANGSYGRVPIRFTNEKKLSSRKLQDGDLVLEVSGGSKDQPTGRSLYLTTGILNQFDCPMEPASFCRLLRPSSPEVGVLLAQHLTYIYALGKTWEYQNQSTGISNFQTTHFLETELVVVPDTKVLKAFFELVRPMVDRANLTQMTKLAELRDSLLPRLISGQLRLPEAEAALAEVI